LRCGSVVDEAASSPVVHLWKTSLRRDGEVRGSAQRRWPESAAARSMWGKKQRERGEEQGKKEVGMSGRGRECYSFRRSGAKATSRDETANVREQCDKGAKGQRGKEREKGRRLTVTIPSCFSQAQAKL